MLRLYILPSLENTTIEVAAPYPPLVIALTVTLYGVAGSKDISTILSNQCYELNNDWMIMTYSNFLISLEVP